MGANDLVPRSFNRGSFIDQRIKRCGLNQQMISLASTLQTSPLRRS